MPMSSSVVSRRANKYIEVVDAIMIKPNHASPIQFCFKEKKEKKIKKKKKEQRKKTLDFFI